MTNTVTAAAFHLTPGRFLDQAQHQPVAILKHGRTHAVLISGEMWQRLGMEAPVAPAPATQAPRAEPQEPPAPSVAQAAEHEPAPERPPGPAPGGMQCAAAEAEPNHTAAPSEAERAAAQQAQVDALVADLMQRARSQR
jgi:PHD/YefM family antitoxin component YafN of YafNO toxin-antitoxin module